MSVECFEKSASVCSARRRKQIQLSSCCPRMLIPHGTYVYDANHPIWVLLRQSEARLTSSNTKATCCPLMQIPHGTYIYDANHPIRLLFRLTGTAAKMALISASFWLIICVHVLLLICYYQTDHNKIRIDTTPGNSPWPFLRSTTYAGFLGTLVSFVLVFQTTQSYSR